MRIEKNIYRRGKHQFQVKLKFGASWITETFESLEHARDWRDLKRVRRNNDPDAIRIESARLNKKQYAADSLASLLETYRDTVSVRKTLPQAETYRINALLRSPIVNLPAASITGEEITQIMDALTSGKLTGNKVGNTTLRKYLSLLSHCYKKARSASRKYWLRNPVNDIERPRADPGRDRRVSDEEFKKMLGELKKSTNPYVAPLAELARYIGARKSELLRLQWKDIDFAKRKIFISGGRDAHGRIERRVVPFNFIFDDGRVDKLLKRLHRLSGKKANVFDTTHSAVIQVWNRARTRAGLEDLRGHDLRHEATSQLFEDTDWKDMEIKTGLGHRSLNTTSLYAHLRLSNRPKTQRVRAYSKR